MSDEIKTVVTEPHNPFLLETFRAFLAESHDPPLACAMTSAHILHLKVKEMERQTDVLHRIATQLERIGKYADPVAASGFLAMLETQSINRKAAKNGRQDDRAKAELGNLLGETVGETDGELAL